MPIGICESWLLSSLLHSDYGCFVWPRTCAWFWIWWQRMNAFEYRSISQLPLFCQDRMLFAVYLYRDLWVLKTHLLSLDDINEKICLGTVMSDKQNYQNFSTLSHAFISQLPLFCQDRMLFAVYLYRDLWVLTTHLISFDDIKEKNLFGSSYVW